MRPSPGIWNSVVGPKNYMHEGCILKKVEFSENECDYEISIRGPANLEL